jgi:EAL domain-containing protein (putative c-di-GMP-specific phosphodiesterase class I)
VIVDSRPLVTTVSIGVSLYPRDGQDMDALLRHSDTAMYQAKDRGRNNFQLFSPVMERKLKERVTVEHSLRGALQRGHLTVHYQPIVDINSNKVLALEALLRWQHPTQGFISPHRFIGVAEETGLIVPIGEFVLQRVMEDARGWRSAGLSLVPIAVNISAVQLQRSNLRDRILELTRVQGVSPRLLQIELTESAMFERREGRSGEAREDVISQLRDLGVRIAIDDFGTGYSSLSYLKRWHVDYLKIDHSFVRDLVTDMSDLAIVGAIIAIARHLNVKVIAEGIEGWQQLEKLRQLGCELGQGFLFAKPAPAAQCNRLLSGEPLDLTQALPRLQSELDATGSSGCDRQLSASDPPAPAAPQPRLPCDSRTSCSSSSEPASAAGLSVRQRTIRGKRTAIPDLWRPEAAMPSKATSKTWLGSTRRVGPNFSSVCPRIQRSSSPIS